MSRKPKKFKLHGPNRKPPPNPPPVPADLVPKGVPRYARNYNTKFEGRSHYLIIAFMTMVLGSILMTTKEAPAQVCLPLVIMVVVIALLLFFFSKAR